jgi:hypothetical protein
MRSLLLTTAGVALGLGIWRIDETLGMLYGLIAAPSLVLFTVERGLRLPESKLFGVCLDVFMAGGAICSVGYCSPSILQSALAGEWGVVLLKVVLGAACGAAIGVAYWIVVILFYVPAKAALKW